MPEAAPSRIPRRDGAAVRSYDAFPRGVVPAAAPRQAALSPLISPGVPRFPGLRRSSGLSPGARSPGSGCPCWRTRVSRVTRHVPAPPPPWAARERSRPGRGRVDARSAASLRRPVPPPGARRGGVRTVEPRQQRARSPSGHSPRGPLAMFFRVNSDVECLRKSESAAGAQCSPLSALLARHRPFGRPPRLPGRESGVDTGTAAGGERADMTERRRAESRGPLQYDPADRDSNTVASVDQERRRGQWGAG